MRYIIGIDPGNSGGIAFYNCKIDVMSTVSAKNLTAHDVANQFPPLLIQYSMCYIELVHSMPKQGVSSTFKFGKNFGQYLGILAALKIPYKLVAPGVWQRSLGCLTKGDKNVTKRKAQQLYPYLKITHAVADAILIAEYGRQKEMGVGRYVGSVEDL